jgi:hypothetical protein
MTFFKKPSEVIDRIHKKYAPDTYVKSQKEMTRERVSEYVDSTILPGTTPTEAVNKTSELIESSGSLTPGEKKVAKELARERIYTQHGITREECTAQSIMNMGKVRTCSRTFYKDICTISGTTYTLCGKIDRLLETEDETIIVEIKNRAKKLFNRVPDYENAQVQAYLEMLDMDKAILVEDFRGTTKSHLIDRDYVCWVDIHYRLENFCKTVHWVIGGKWSAQSA